MLNFLQFFFPTSFTSFPTDKTSPRCHSQYTKVIKLQTPVFYTFTSYSEAQQVALTGFLSFTIALHFFVM